jgi:hypothetical protein
VVAIADHALSTSIVTSAGALEVAVHGWDVSQATGVRAPVPAALARDLLIWADVLVSDADRPGRFAAPVRVAAWADESDRLVAFLGRDPALPTLPDS